MDGGTQIQDTLQIRANSFQLCPIKHIWPCSASVWITEWLVLVGLSAPYLFVYILSRPAVGGNLPAEATRTTVQWNIPENIPMSGVFSGRVLYILNQRNLTTRVTPREAFKWIKCKVEDLPLAFMIASLAYLHVHGHVIVFQSTTLTVRRECCRFKSTSSKFTTHTVKVALLAYYFPTSFHHAVLHLRIGELQTQMYSCIKKCLD